MDCDALLSFSVSRVLAGAPSSGLARPELTNSQNSRSRATRCGAALPVISAALMAPIEMPATQVGSW